MARLAAPGVALLLLAPLIFGLIPGAAAAPDAPLALTGRVGSISYQAGAPHSFAVHLIWRLAADDTDQLVGDFNYTMLDNGASQGNATALGSAFPNLARAGAPGWIHYENDTATWLVGGDTTHTFRIQAWDDDTPGALSCTISLDVGQINDHAQCGEADQEDVEVLVGYVESIGTGGSKVELRVNLTWQWSEGDQDQTDGNWTYRAAYVHEDYSATPFDVPHVAVAGAPGWGTNVADLSIEDVPGDDFPVAIQLLGYNRTIAWLTEANCDVSFSFNFPGTGTTPIIENDGSNAGEQDQCGTTLAKPPGVIATVTETCSGDCLSDPAQIDLRVALSPEDPSQTSGAFTYLGVQKVGSVRLFSPFEGDGRGDVTVAGLTGTRKWLHSETSEGAGFQYGFFAQNATTNERSPISCLVSPDNGFGGEVSCGSAPETDAETGGIGGQDTDQPLTTGGPQFPGINVTELAEAAGFEAAAFGWFLAMILVLAGIIGGALAAGPAGGAIGGAIGFGLALLMNLVPLYAAIVAWVGAVAVIAVTLGGRE